jgi:hypothetical protein
MALKAYGTPAYRILPETCRLRQKRQGLTEGEAHFEITGPLGNAQSLINALPKLNSQHPFSTNVYMEQRELIMLPYGVRAECRYAGVSDEDLDRPVYSLVVGTEEQPIEVHPKFESHIAGKPSDPLNGAIFVNESGALTISDLFGTFAGFTAMVKTGPTTFIKNPFAGIESYLDVANITYRERYVTRDLPRDFDNNAGKIWVGPLPGPNPEFQNRTWLYMGYSMEQRGASLKRADPISRLQTVYDIARDWRLSMFGGWNNLIYG